MKHPLKRKISLFFSVIIIVTSIPLTALSKEPNTPVSVGEIGGYLEGNAYTAKNLYLERQFTGPGGHGFAAERANNLSDVLRGKKAAVVGGDNVKNGPDRRIINRDGSVTWIQDKYYKSATESVNAAFDSETGNYRYYDAKGNPMQLEVPKDQYEAAVQRMREKISAGKVDGVTNPTEAENYVRKSNYTYEQAVNITKAGNIDSLVYDAKNGAITATVAFGITFVLDYAACRINGQDNKEAFKNASLNGLKTGSIVCGSYIIASQLAKTGLASALAPASEAVAKALGPGIQKALVESAGLNALEMSEAQLAKAAGKVLQSNLIVTAVVIVALSTPEIIDLFHGRISKKQLAKDLAILFIAGAGAVAGGVAGTAVAPGPGTAVGGIVGGAASGFLGEKALSIWYEGDAAQMYKVITEEFQSLAEAYLINKEEGEEITVELQKKLKDKTLKDMYASEDRKKFAKDLLTPMFKEEVKKRDKIVLPTEEQARSEYLELMKGIVFIH